MGISGFSQTKPGSEDAKIPKFDVVSIRPSNGARPAGGSKILPDGYQAIGMTLLNTIALAYAPAPYFNYFDHFKGYPSWAFSDDYDFQAKLAPEDVAQWRKLNQSIMQTPNLLQKMLRQVLADRCNLRIHTADTKIDGYALRIRAKSPALVEDSTLPASGTVMELTDGAKAVYSVQDGVRTYTFYNTSMPVLATFLTVFTQHPVEDRTGLQGRYKFVLHRLTPPPSDQGMEPQSEMPVPWDLGALGMKVDSQKVQSTIWFVDNIERPSSN
jgi:uncharacterized protein (TIGR03435 family)